MTNKQVFGIYFPCLLCVFLLLAGFVFLSRMDPLEENTVVDEGLHENIDLFTGSVAINRKEPSEGYTVVDEAIDLIVKWGWYKDVDLEYCRKVIEAHRAGREISSPNGDSVCFDKNSRFLSPQGLSEMLEVFDGKYSGLGLSFSNDGSGNIVVEDVKRGSAYGVVLPGDILQKVIEVSDDDSHRITTEEEARKFLRGPEGTSAVLTVLRGGELINLPPIERVVFDEPNVFFDILPSGIGYIRIDLFDKRSPKMVVEALESFRDERARPAAIIDLRNNPGGIMESVRKIASLFAREQGEVIMEFRTRNQTLPYGAKLESSQQFANYQVVVLINKDSASASEVFAGVMQEWSRNDKSRDFTIIGEISFGKGTVQTVFDLSDGSGIVLTIAEYFVGENAKKIEGLGVKPDITIIDTIDSWADALTSKDAQFMRAYQLLGGCGECDDTEGVEMEQ